MLPFIVKACGFEVLSIVNNRPWVLSYLKDQGKHYERQADFQNLFTVNDTRCPIISYEIVYDRSSTT